MKNPFFDKLVLGLHFDGANGGASFLDSVSGNVWSATGATLSSTEARFGGTSGAFGGAGYLSGSAPGMSQVGEVWSFGCFFWVSAAPTADAMIFDSRNASGLNGLAVYLDANARLCFSLRPVSGGAISLAGGAIPLSAWNFAGITCLDGVLTLALNGARLAFTSSASGRAFNNATGIQIGRSYSGANPFSGFIDDLSFYRGVGIYSGATHQVPGDPFGDQYGWDVLESIDPVSRALAGVPALAAALDGSLIGSPDIYYGGRGVVTGTVKTKGSPANVPVVRRVRLYRDVDGALVGETWSNADGVYAFDRLDPLQTYTAIAYDHTGLFESTCGSKLPAKVAA